MPRDSKLTLVRVVIATLLGLNAILLSVIAVFAKGTLADAHAAQDAAVAESMRSQIADENLAGRIDAISQVVDRVEQEQRRHREWIENELNRIRDGKR